jgi:hypothetical protein
MGLNLRTLRIVLVLALSMAWSKISFRNHNANGVIYPRAVNKGTMLLGGIKTLKCLAVAKSTEPFSLTRQLLLNPGTSDRYGFVQRVYIFKKSRQNPTTQT